MWIPEPLGGAQWDYASRVRGHEKTPAPRNAGNTERARHQLRCGSVSGIVKLARMGFWEDQIWRTVFWTEGLFFYPPVQTNEQLLVTKRSIHWSKNLPWKNHAMLKVGARSRTFRQISFKQLAKPKACNWWVLIQMMRMVCCERKI